MLLNIKYNANWAEIRLCKQPLIGKAVVKENKSRIQHDYKVGDKVLYTKPGFITKMDQPQTGSHVVRQVYTNDTISIQRGAVTDRVNIRNITLFFE